MTSASSRIMPSSWQCVSLEQPPANVAVFVSDGNLQLAGMRFIAWDGFKSTWEDGTRCHFKLGKAWWSYGPEVT